jgi:tetratricopeptide (TPR) repeat protein
VRDLRRPLYERNLLHLSGRLHLANEHNAVAEADFARAIAMARAVGLGDTDSEAGRGLALLRLGRRADAEAAAASAEREPPYSTLSELYLELGEPDKARQHAQAGYDWYRADGPPFTDHWELQRCRAVLARLNEPVPDPPPFDPAKQEPIPFEADIVRLLREHEAKQKHKKT